MGRRPDAARPNWAEVERLALAPDALPRVLAEMFSLHCGVVARGDIRWWPPEYVRVEAWRERMMRSNTEAGRGLRMGRWDDAGVARHDAWAAVDRAAWAATNRAIRDAPVHLLADRPPARGGIWALDSSTGEWRAAITGGARGDRLIELAMLRWGCSWGRAGHRLAKAVGLRGVPLVVADAA